MMIRLVLPISALVLASTALAQSYTTSPKGFELTEGNSSAYILGSLATGRFMTFDGEQLGSPMVIKGLALRCDNQVYTTGTGMGRSWTNLQIWASECDLTKITSTFTTNPTTTPSKVFDKSADWPTMSGKPPKLPADWDLQFPFSSNWSYTGNQGLCLDYVFTGGTLANAGSWGSSQINYHVDTTDPSLYSSATSSTLGESGANRGCNDRGTTHVYGASLSTTANFYSDTYSNASYAGRLRFDLSGNYFGYSTQVLTVLGFRSIRAGVPFPGVTCNQLHIDLAFPTLLFMSFSTGTGQLSLQITGQYGQKVDAAAGGNELVTQAAWADTQNQSLMISDAAQLIIPWKPQSFDHRMLYSSNPSSTYGSGPYGTRHYNALIRYTR